MSLVEQMRERRAAQKVELDALLGAAESRDDSNLTEDESAKFDSIVAEIRKADERIVELEDLAKREAAASETRRLQAGHYTPATTEDPPVYIRSGANGNSYFQDLAKRRDHGDSMDRLRRNSKMAEAEQRALGNTGAAGGSGGEFSPPDWMINEWVNIIRAGRVTPDLYRKMDIPDGVSSINIPKITGGTTVAIQSTQNSALSQTDMTTGYVQTGWATIGGKQVVAQQLLDQTAVGFDQIISADLAADYARQVGLLTFTGAGTGAGTTSMINGLSNATVANTVTWTQAAPTGSLFYSQLGKLLSAFEGLRLAKPSHFVMHPRRWYWLSTSVDTAGRPLIPPTGPTFNVIGDNTNAAVPSGIVGVVHGVPVVIDPQVPTTVSTNQDVVYLIKADDLLLFESNLRFATFVEPYADSLGVLFRLHNYVGTMLNRHPESIGMLTGTGLAIPAFAG